MRHIILVLIVLGLAGIPPADAVARADDIPPGAWSSVRLNFRRSVTVATVGSKVLFAGVEADGADPVNHQLGAVVRIYEGATGQWSVSALSEVRGDFVATTVGSQALFLGGIGAHGPTTTVDIYDSTTDRWSAGRLSHPIFGGGTPADPRVDRTAVIVGSRVALLGSYTDTTGARPEAFDLYDSATGQWSRAALSRGRGHIVVATVGDRVLFAGGSSSRGGRHADERFDFVDVYDATGDRWSTASLSYPRVPMTTAVVADKVLFIGHRPTCGYCMPGPSDVVVDVYDAAVDRA